MTMTVSRSAARAAAHDHVALHGALARSAGRHLNPDRWLLTAEDQIDLDLFSGYDDALEWLTSTADLHRAVVRTAHVSGLHTECWQLCEALLPHLRGAQDFETWRISHKLGLRSAAHCGPAPMARMLSGLGSCYQWEGRLDEAEAEFVRAEQLWLKADHTLGRASLSESLGLLALREGDLGLAEARFLRALRLFTELGRDRGIWLIQRRLGETALAARNFTKAIHYLTSSRAWFADRGDRYQVVRNTMSLARSLAGAGQQDQAQQELEEAAGAAGVLKVPALEREVRELAASLASVRG